MPLSANAVRVAITGAAYVAPLNSVKPTDATTPWPDTATDIGWISDDGITESNSADTTEIKGWQGGQTVRKVISSSEMTFQFTAIETSKTVLELYHKGSKVVTTSVRACGQGTGTSRYGVSVRRIPVSFGNEGWGVYLTDREPSQDPPAGLSFLTHARAA